MPSVSFRTSEEQHAELLRRAGDQTISRYLKEFLGLDQAGRSPIEELRDTAEALDRRVSRLEALAEGSDY